MYQALSSVGNIEFKGPQRIYIPVGKGWGDGQIIRLIKNECYSMLESGKCYSTPAKNIMSSGMGVNCDFKWGNPK